MGWQVIGINSPARLRTKDNRLVVEQEDVVSVPLEDIDALIFDSYGITTTANLLTELSNHGTTVVICDEKHLPASVLLPYSQHSRQAKVSRNQLNMSKPFQKKLWQKIIIQKIFNQADVLSKYSHEDTQLRKLAAQVKSNDSTNRESIAARLYFTELLEDATRRKPMWHNAALNYGYAMVRSHIARHIAARGLIPSQGIFHHSELNSFNLADDFIETYRPAVDDYILSQIAPFHIANSDASLTKEDRQIIVDVLNQVVIINKKKFTIKHAVERTVESFVQAVENNDESLIKLNSIVSR